MAEVLLVRSVVSLVKLASETYANAKAHLENQARLGQRLATLLVLTQQWAHDAAPPAPALVALYKALERLNMALQAATTPKSHWSRPVRKMIQQREAIAALAKAETELNAVLLDFTVYQNHFVHRQSNAYHGQLVGHLARVEQQIL